MIREAEPNDLNGLLGLYTQLRGGPLPANPEAARRVWRQILADPNHHVFVAEREGRLVSSCVLLIVPNLTHGQRPYGLVENVVTDGDFRKQGLASACLARAKEIAEEENCYKLILLTGSKQESTLHFYERAGYNKKDKTAFIQWLP